jgi:hypothetical protein
MLTRRNLLKHSGIAALAVVGSDLFMRTARSQGASFDYYISPTGDDNNPGTLASPWSITALNSKMGTYSGKRIGIIGDVGGVQTPIQFGTVGGKQTTIYSMMQAINGGNQNAALRVNGGSSSASTYLGSCTSAGAYKVGWAIIDAANPANGAAPVGAQAIIMGQPFYQTTPVPNIGYTTIDGLVLRNFNYAAIIFGDVQLATLNGVIIQNCKIYNGICSTGDENPGAIFFGTIANPQVLNCLIYNCQTTGGTNNPWGLAGITSYKAQGLVVTHCTIASCGYSIRQKDTHQWGTFSYNYFDNGNFGSATNRQNQDALKGPIPGPGQTLTVHHNIIIGGGYWGFGEDGLKIDGSMNFYNNTFYTPPAVTAMALAAWFDTNPDAGSITWQNNLVYFNTYYVNQGGPFGCLGFQAAIGITGTSVDYNYYGTGMNFGTSSPFANLNLWRVLGFDSHSTSGGNPFSGTPTSQVPSSFAITGPATTAGRNGKPCGALDGSGTVGCNFAAAVAGTPAPAAPVLTSVT